MANLIVETELAGHFGIIEKYQTSILNCARKRKGIVTETERILLKSFQGPPRNQRYSGDTDSQFVPLLPKARI